MNYQFGVDYYPEHWPENRWPIDAQLMHDMGIKVVRLAEFAWHKLEPQEGQFDFSWLDRALEVLHRQGIVAVLGTPSAAPPSWLIQAHPEILPVNSQGTRLGFGGRHHDCQSNPTYRRYVTRIVTELAQRFGKDPRVVGWQPDNELGNSHDDLCHCEHCRSAFQSWLQEKYQTIGNLNEAWGTVFWSQTYNHFDEIPTPMITPTAHSPSLLLDWKRFHSDLIVSFLQFQVDILRAQAPKQFITHNFMGYFDLVDYFDLAKNLDFVSHDQYPVGFWDQAPGRSPGVLASTLDLMAGLKGKAFWIMEQQAGPTGWQILAETPKPGQLALWAAQSIAHGADTVVFFRWRSCTVGTEQYWHGILPHNGIPGRRYQELQTLIRDLGPLMPEFEGALHKAEVGILVSYEQNWALEIQPHHPEFDYWNFVRDAHEAFFKKNIPVAFVSPTEDWTKYKAIVLPPEFLELPARVAACEAYVRQGGNLILAFRSGVKTASNLCVVDAALPGAFRELAGIEILDYDCLRGDQVSLDNGLGTLWWDCVTPVDAKVVMTAKTGPHQGEPFLTKNSLGAGTCWYVATQPDPAAWNSLVEHWQSFLELASLGKTPEGVELCRRRGQGADYLFVLNHTAEIQTYHPGADWSRTVGTERVGAYGYAVYVRQVVR